MTEITSRNKDKGWITNNKKRIILNLTNTNLLVETAPPHTAEY